MKEKFAIPAVGAIIVKRDAGEEIILVQNRRKNNGDRTDGLLEIPAGKVREYENIFEALRREVREETGLHLTKVRGEEDRQFLNIDGNKTIAFSPYCVTQNLSGTCCIRLTQNIFMVAPDVRAWGLTMQSCALRQSFVPACPGQDYIVRRRKTYE